MEFFPFLLIGLFILFGPWILVLRASRDRKLEREEDLDRWRELSQRVVALDGKVKELQNRPVGPVAPSVDAQPPVAPRATKPQPTPASSPVAPAIPAKPPIQQQEPAQPPKSSPIVSPTPPAEQPKRSPAASPTQPPGVRPPSPTPVRPPTFSPITDGHTASAAHRQPADLPPTRDED